MKLSRTLQLTVASLLLLPAPSLLGQQKKIVVGILPTYDISGESYGPSVSQMMTSLLFQEYAASQRFLPIYLNPGGNYDPSSAGSITDYVQTLDTPVDFILSTMFVQPEDPKKGDLILHLKATRIDPKAAAPLEWTASKPFKERNALLTFASTQNQYVNTSNQLFQPREFRKQPLGKAAADLVSQIVQKTSTDAAKFPASGDTPAVASSKSCKMQLRINFEEKHAISKSYTIFIEDRDETLGIKEGLLDVTENAGRLSILIALHDKPYKLPVQDVYLFDPTLDCSRTSNFLNVNIGPAGEAHTVWR